MEQNQSEMESSKPGGKPHVRKRKKQYYNRIRQQMEFYFGDANLSKDRFLNKLLAINPYVPLEVFMNFNKMKEMSSGLEDIQRALESSEMLELSNDRQSVRRITEIRTKEDLDEYMVYVELLPPNATHESVRQQFKQFGKIAYVSLPRYRTSGRIKEFAFIEFEDKSSVVKCIEAFRKFNAVIGDAQNPENLKSVVSYVKEQEELEKQEAGENNSQEDDHSEVKNECEGGDVKENECAANEVKEESDASTSCEQHEKNSKKRSIEEASTSEEVPTKRPKVEELENEQEKVQKIENEQKPEQNENDEHEKDDDDDDDGDGQGNTSDDKGSIADENNENRKRKKKNRKRRKRNTSQTALKNPVEEMPLNHGHLSDDGKKSNDPNKFMATLRVTTKTEWKRLRNTYLTLQRQKYSEVKKLLLMNKNNDSKKSTLPPSKVRPVTMKSKDSPPPPKKICTRNINFYGANRDEHNANTYECSIINENKPDVEEKKESESTDKKVVAKDVQFEFEPGLIVKINFDEPCTDVADFKAEMKQYPFVQYVDVKEGQMHAFVRVDAPRSATMLIKRCAPITCQILTGAVETEYWAKIARDREQKLSKAVKVPRNRSRKMRNLIKTIAEVHVVKTDNKTSVTHIRFDDDD